MTDVAAGWYPDPQDPALIRWWDREWTDVTRKADDEVASATLVPVTPVEVFAPVAEPAREFPVQVTQYPPFFFDGGAGTYFGTGVLAALVTIFSLGIALPFAIVLRQRWLAKHSYIEGRRLMFTGTGIGLFGHWIKWWLLIIVTFGIYSFWVVPRLTKWKVEHQAFDPRGQAQF